MTDPTDIAFNFVDTTDIYFSLSYRFIAEQGSESDLISFKELSSFGTKLEESENSAPFINAVYDKRKTSYSLSQDFCDPSKQNLPFVVSINLNTLIPDQSIDAGVGAPSEMSSGNNRIVLQDAMVRISHYGVGSVRLHYEIRWEEGDFEEFTGVINRLREDSGVTTAPDDTGYAHRIWREFIEIWNRLADRNVRTTPRQIDHYMTVFSRGINVTYQGTTFPLVHTKGEPVDKEYEEEINNDTAQLAKQKLIGVNKVSNLWPQYTTAHVEEEIRKDLSQTRLEYQFVNWKNAFILRDSRSEKEKALSEEEGTEKFADYFQDMLLAIELLLMMRSSLQLLESLIDEESKRFFNKNTRLWGIINIQDLQDYYFSIERFDEWLASTKHWRRIERHTAIAHYHSFLNEARSSMRVNNWLNTIDEKLDHLRNTYYIQSNKLEAVNLIGLTIILVVLTIILVIFAL